MSDDTTEKPTPDAPAADAAPTADAPAKADAPAQAVEPKYVVTTGDWIFLGIVSVVTAAADLGSKAWAMNALSRTQSNPPPLCVPPPGMQHYLPQRMGTRDITLITNYLDFQYAENCGGAWGALHSVSESFRRPFFLLVTVAAIAFIVNLYRSLEKGQTATKWALPLVLGGAVGNLVDRVRLGYVVDFIHMHVKTRFHWPTYNVADIAITVGIGLLMLEYVIGPKPAPKKPAASVPATPATAE